VHEGVDLPGLRGLWQRSLFAWPGGRRDTTTRVHWLQAERACIDLRQPAELPDFQRVRNRSELSIEQCAGLAAQQGFAGQLSFDGSYFEWTRSIDYQPTAAPDAGSLSWQGDTLVESGRDIAYIEHWQRDATAPTEPCAALSLRAADENIAAALLRVGRVFMFARDRAVELGRHPTLAACVAGASTLRQAQEFVDCEISFGEVQRAGFHITASTLPYRIGDVLRPQFDADCLMIMDRAVDGAPRRRPWDITDSEGELETLIKIWT
jgi:hypothetical protein